MIIVFRAGRERLLRAGAVLLASSMAAFSAAGHAMDAVQHHQHGMQHGTPHATPLTAPGNAAFAAIQEVVVKLLADPDTDWRRVNLEALRRHLVDMQNFVLNVDVTRQEPVAGGVEFTVKATTPGAAASLDRLFSAHPAILKQETGWDMIVVNHRDGAYTARVTSANPDDVMKIRGLGYIGIVAMGRHHQMHHWLMATGSNPHKAH